MPIIKLHPSTARLTHYRYTAWPTRHCVHSLPAPGMDDENEAIYSQSAYRMDDIENNHIIIADKALLDEVYEM